MKLKTRWKKILHNCPYLLALLIMWLFITIGGIGLMIYRDYGNIEWETIWSRPFFAVIMKEEMHQSATVPPDTDAPAKTDVPANTDVPEVEPVMLYTDASDTPDGTQEGAAVPETPESLENEKVQTGETEGDNPPVKAGQELKTVSGQNDVEQGGIEAAETEKEIVGKTVFVSYEPVETDSIYYYDVGQIALTTEYPYEEVEEDYFDDAAFLGDSRTMGISDYAGLNADFYCENGMTIYKLFDEKGVVYQKTGEKVDLSQALQQKQYGKIYIMLGMNELGYRDTEYFKEQYQAVLDKIREWQPDAVIYVMANLHISQKKNNIKTEFNNININAKNVAAASLADGIDVFYLDINPLFIDSDGYLNADLTFDGVHLYANGYLEWKNFLMKYGVVRDDEGRTGQDQ